MTRIAGKTFARSMFWLFFPFNVARKQVSWQATGTLSRGQTCRESTFNWKLTLLRLCFTVKTGSYIYMRRLIFLGCLHIYMALFIWIWLFPISIWRAFLRHIDMGNRHIHMTLLGSEKWSKLPLFAIWQVLVPYDKFSYAHGKWSH